MRVSKDGRADCPKEGRRRRIGPPTTGARVDGTEEEAHPRGGGPSVDVAGPHVPCFPRPGKERCGLLGSPRSFRLGLQNQGPEGHRPTDPDVYRCGG